jgi:hypothetical protein
MDDPPTDVESLEQLNEWRINHRKLGPREFARVLKDGIFLCKYVTVDAMEVLIKYCINSFPQVDQFIRIQISFYFLCVSYWSIGSETKSN